MEALAQFKLYRCLCNRRGIRPYNFVRFMTDVHPYAEF